MALNYPAPLPADEQIELCKRAQAGDIAARNRLVETTMRLVAKIARKGLGISPSSDIEDLISEGSLGIMRAIELFDPSKGFNFSTYVMTWIEHHVRVAAWRDRDVPRSYVARMRVLVDYRKHIADGLSDHQAIEAISSATGKKITTVRALVDVLSRTSHRSLDAPITEDGDALVEMMAASTGAYGGASPEEEVGEKRYDEMVAEAIEWALEPLCERDRDIIQRRYLSEDEETLLEIGERWDVTSERIRQLESSALATVAERISERLDLELPSGASGNGRRDSASVRARRRCAVCGGRLYGSRRCGNCGATADDASKAGNAGQQGVERGPHHDLSDRRRACSTCGDWFTPATARQHRCDRCSVPPAKRSVFDLLVPKGSPDAARAEAELRRRRNSETARETPPSQPLSTCASFLCGKRFMAASTVQLYCSRACEREDTGATSRELPAQQPTAPSYVRCSRPGCGSVISPPPRLYQPGTLVYCGTKCSALSAQSTVTSNPIRPSTTMPAPLADAAEPSGSAAESGAPVPLQEPATIAIEPVPPASDVSPPLDIAIIESAALAMAGEPSNPDRICEREGCGKPVAMPQPGRRGMRPRYCSHACRDRANYLRDVARREAETRPPAIAAGEQPQLPATLICEDCGREFERNAMGPLRKACRECNPTWYEPNPQPDPRPCARSACGETFQPLTEAQIYCSLPCRQAKENRAASERAKARDAHEAEHGSHGALEKTCAYAKCSRTFLTDNPRRKHCTMACAENAQKARARDRARLLTQSTNEVKYGGAMGDVVNMKRVCQLKTCGTEFAATSADQRFCSSEHETEERCLAGCDAAHKPRARFRVLPDGTIECDDPLDALELRDLIAQRRSA